MPRFIDVFGVVLGEGRILPSKGSDGDAVWETGPCEGKKDLVLRGARSVVFGGGDTFKENAPEGLSVALFDFVYKGFDDVSLHRHQVANPRFRAELWKAKKAMEMLEVRQMVLCADIEENAIAFEERGGLMKADVGVDDDIARELGNLEGRIDL